MKNIKLIANPTAGKGKALGHIEHVKTYLEGNSLEIALTEGQGHAIELAKESKGLYDIVVACGGDGTISEVVNGLAESDTTLGIIPTGTANVFAYEFNIPMSLEDACNKILTGDTKLYDLGKMDSRYFACWGGVGLDAAVIKEVDPDLKRKFGSAAFPWTAALKTIPNYKPTQFRLESNEEIYRGYWAVFGKMKYWGGNVPMLPDAKSDDGYLDVCIFKRKINLQRSVRYSFPLIIGEHVKLKNVEYFKTIKLKVSSQGLLPMHADCELLPDSKEVEIEIVPKALNVIV
jgi:YegS/Rv2252/BmrU family lipid kinase